MLAWRLCTPELRGVSREEPWVHTCAGIAAEQRFCSHTSQELAAASLPCTFSSLASTALCFQPLVDEIFLKQGPALWCFNQQKHVLLRRACKVAPGD